MKREATRTELLIVRALARTSSAAQFLCTPDDDVYTADTDGWALPSGRRDYLTGLSQLLDETAEIFNEWRRDGKGGRFYERDGCFFDADDGEIFLEIRITQHNGDYLDWGAYVGLTDASDAGSENARPAPPERSFLQKLWDWVWD